MKKIMIVFAAMAIFAFAHMSVDVLAGGMKDPAKMTHAEVSHMFGREVRNMEGEHLGLVRDFLHDHEGRISFAIVSTGGFLGFRDKKVVVPYSALTYDAEEQIFICDVRADRFAEAPAFERREKVIDHGSAEEVYRYFGLRPYWTEERMEMEEWDWEY